MSKVKLLTPLQVCEGYSVHYIADRFGTTLATSDVLRNAESIAHCVNTYDDLVKALESALAEQRTNHGFTAAQLARIGKILTAALAKAKGEAS